MKFLRFYGLWSSKTIFSISYTFCKIHVRSVKHAEYKQKKTEPASLLKRVQSFYRFIAEGCGR